MIGGFFKYHFSNQAITLKIDDPKSPLTAMFNGQPLEIKAILTTMGGHVEPVSIPPVSGLGKLPTVNPELEGCQTERGRTELFGGWIAHWLRSRHPDGSAKGLGR